MLRIAFVGLWTLIATATSLAQDATQAWEREKKAYINCNLAASRSIARQQGDPLSLAIAALGMCGRESRSLAGDGQSVPPLHGVESARLGRRQQLEANAAAIVRQRANAPPSPRPPTARSVKSGTGFYVSQEGHVLTNDHVVTGCQSALVEQPGHGSRFANIVARDTVNDLALLSTAKTTAAVPPFKVMVQTGETIAVYGFPFAGILPTTGNFTMGHVTATAGLEDNPRILQISAPIQPGNSGGPLMDERGNIVGVVVAQIRPGFAQNVNFAIKASVALGFLARNGVSAGSAPASVAPLSSVDLAERAQRFTVFLACEREVNGAAQPDAVKGFRVQDAVSQGILNMRSGPGQGHRIVVSIPAGSGGIKVVRCREADDNGGGPRWCEVQWGQHVGWVSSCCLQPEEDSTAKPAISLIGFVAVVGSMAQREGALKLASDVRARAGPGLRNKSIRVKEEIVSDNRMYRVVVEPPSSRAEAEATCAHLRVVGFYECFLTAHP